ncbi:MAG: endolytic transglycosylase MltG [Chitinophagaceae bacterium]|nr:endolytic transglycosylase MltG [Chitinophagaceae bacterium]
MKKKILLATMAFIILLAGFFAWKLFGPAVSVNQESYLFIKTGSSYEDVQKELTRNDFIGGNIWFGMASKIIGYKKVKPGRYKLSDGMSMTSLVRLLNNGHQTPVNFVITKIRTKETLADKIGNAFECDSLQMIDFLNDPDSLKPYGLDTNTVMAVAMPFTYDIKWNTTPSRIFQQFYTAYKTFWSEERKQKADSLKLTPLEVSVLASIIDEETNAAVDRPDIASVYLNRIKKGMPLQADPTLKFALKNFGLKRVLNEHKNVVSPYNTYINKGLPPGPICTPQLETIDAVLNSPQTDYLYFVANSDFSGTHIFTTNYEDHMKYARLYQEELNKRNIK